MLFLTQFYQSITLTLICDFMNYICKHSNSSVCGLFAEGLWGDTEVASHVLVDSLDHIDVVALKFFEVIRILNA